MPGLGSRSSALASRRPGPRLVGVSKTVIGRWRADFFAGLAVLLPAILTVWLMWWIVRNIAAVTDTLLFFLPTTWTHTPEGGVIWWWSLIALLLAVVLLAIAGRMARYYIGRRALGLIDQVLLQVPLVNKIYGTIKQVNEAFTSGKKSSFQEVVMVEFPQPGHRALGFITGTPSLDLTGPQTEPMVNVFVPTTPNPTSGFLLVVPERSVRRLAMPVSDGIKFIISLGALSFETAAENTDRP
jgi:uncharacterized membrane protein